MGFLPYENLSLHTNVLHHLTLLVFHHFSLSECGTHSHFSPPFKFHQQRGDLGSLDFYQTFSPDENSSLRIYVPRRPILPLFDPFSLSVCAVRHPISIQPHLAFISKWWRGTMVALFSVPLFFSFLFFYIKARRASSDRQHCTFDCTVLQETDFFFLWLIKGGFLIASLFFAVLGSWI